MTDNPPCCGNKLGPVGADMAGTAHTAASQSLTSKALPCKQSCGAAKQSLWYSWRVRRKQTRATHALMVRRMLMTPVVVMMRIPTATIAPIMQMLMMSHVRNHLFQKRP